MKSPPIFVLLLLATILLFGCIDDSGIESPPYTTSQFIARTTDLNVQQFFAGVYDGKCFFVDGNKVSVQACDTNGNGFDTNTQTANWTDSVGEWQIDLNTIGNINMIGGQSIINDPNYLRVSGRGILWHDYPQVVLDYNPINPPSGSPELSFNVYQPDGIIFQAFNGLNNAFTIFRSDLTSFNGNMDVNGDANFYGNMNIITGTDHNFTLGTSHVAIISGDGSPLGLQNTKSDAGTNVALYDNLGVQRGFFGWGNSGAGDYANAFSVSTIGSFPLKFFVDEVEKLKINTDGTIQMNQYTSNGFVKTSGSNGLITIDTNTYLTDAVSDGNTYGRKNGSWEKIVTGSTNDTNWETSFPTFDANMKATYSILASCGVGQAIQTTTNGSYSCVDLNSSIASFGNVELWLYKQSTGILDYNKMTKDYNISRPKETYSFTLTTTDTNLVQFISTDLNTTRIENGIIALHIHANKTSGAGTKNIKLYYDLFKRDAGGVETLLVTSEQSDILPSSEDGLDIHGIIATTDLNANDMLLVKVHGLTTGVGTNPSLNLYTAGSTSSHFELTIDLNLDGRYVQKTTTITINGVTQDLSENRTYNIVGSGNDTNEETAGNISGSGVRLKDFNFGQKSIYNAEDINADRLCLMGYCMISDLGRFVLGSSSASTISSALLELVTEAVYGGITATTYSSTVVEAPILALHRSKSATKGTQTVVSAGDAIGYIRMRGSDGNGFIAGAGFNATIDGTPSTNSMPAKLCAGTTSTGDSAPTMRYCTDSNGVTQFNYDINYTGADIIQSRVFAFKSGDQIIANNTISRIDFNVETIDTLGEFTPATGTFTAKNNGYYLVVVNINWENTNSTKPYQTYIRKNSSNVTVSYDQQDSSGQSFMTQNTSAVVYLTVGDTITGLVYQNSGGNETVNGDSNTVTTISIVRA